MPTAAAAIVQVRTSADALEHADRHAALRADLVRAGLDAATRALYELQLSEASQRPRYRESIDALAIATATIDRTRPLTEELTPIRTAFREAVRTIFAATGAGEPEVLTVVKKN